MPARFTQAQVERFLRGCRKEGLAVRELAMTVHPDESVTFSAKTMDETPAPRDHEGPRQWG